LFNLLNINIMACINGTNFLVYLNGVAIAGSRSCTLNLTTDTPSCATKDSGGWEEVMNGLRAYTIDVDGLLQFDNYWATDDIVDLQINRTKVTIKFATTTQGDAFWEGEAVLQTSGLTADMEQPSTATYTFQGTGPLIKMTVS
jgi:predicted secreted protein